MKRDICMKIRMLLAVVALALGCAAMSAQNSLPAPGSGGSFRPNTGGSMGGPGWGGGGPGPGWGGGGPGWGGSAWGPGPGYWGSPWYNGYDYSPTIVVSPSVTTNSSQNQGIEKVVACGYDATGVWRVLPLVVSYQWDGVQYIVNVLNAWNPWTDQWEKGVDVEAYNTNYQLRNVTYDFYAVLPFGTFYFNLS